MDRFGWNLRLAGRQLWRNPSFSITVIFTLALAIGANAAIFSLVNALMLRSLPYSHPERLGTINLRVPGSSPSDGRAGINGERWELLRDNVPALISAASGSTSGVNLLAGSHAQYVHDGRISAHYLDVLALQPLIGRNFSLEEDRQQGPKSAILSYKLWHDIFDADRNILGRTILLKGEPYAVIGVLPEGAVTPLNADLYTALQPSRSGEGEGTNYEVITRLREGASWQQADAQINHAWSVLFAGGHSVSPGTHPVFYSVPLQKSELASLRPQLLALMLSAGLILLIACANLAGLTLVRVLRRTSEVATRLSLGASQWQIQQQLWIENLLLALVGGIVAIGVGFLALRGLMSLLPENFLPVASVTLDGRVLSFTLLLSLLTCVFFGMLPALVIRKVDLRSSMASRAVVGSGGQRLRQSLIAGEVALTVVLLAASGLLIRTLVHLETLPPGFNSQGVVVAKASLEDARFRDPAAFRNLLSQSTEAMRQLPGVQNAAVGLSLPYERALNDGVSLRDGREAGQMDITDETYVTPGYFETLQMHLLAGRTFSEEDGPDSQHVAVVNGSFAHKFYGTESPVGHYIDKDTLIIGEVADVSVSSGISASAPLTSEQAIYIPAAQVDASLLAVHVWFQPNWIVRTAAPVEGLTQQMQSALARVDPDLPFSGFYRMNDLLNRTLATQRIQVTLLGVMSGLALLLSAIGIVALVSNLVTQKTREIGIRIALGSSISQAMSQVAWPSLEASAVGILSGLFLSAGVLRVMRTELYGIEVYDARSLMGAVLVLAGAALLATTIPALRITKIDPARTLRED